MQDANAKPETTRRHLFTWGDMWKSYWWGWFIGALSAALTVYEVMHHG